MIPNTTRSVTWLTFILAAVAGYCDTVTFVSGDAIFSAHVTGNFIVFAAQAVSGAGADSWVKLLTFPVFVGAVMIGGWLSVRISRSQLLLTEGAILLLAGLLALITPGSLHIDAALQTYVVVLITVFAMGLQNAFGKLFAKETHGPTTMMTGNVTQVALDLAALVTGKGNAQVVTDLRRMSSAIGGFFAGCLIGALAAGAGGLKTILAPAIAMLLCYFLTGKQKNIAV